MQKYFIPLIVDPTHQEGLIDGKKPSVENLVRLSFFKGIMFLFSFFIRGSFRPPVVRIRVKGKIIIFLPWL
jgi:hypothetical protein